jgi:hypothetical protein
MMIRPITHGLFIGLERRSNSISPRWIRPGGIKVSHVSENPAFDLVKGISRFCQKLSNHFTVIPAEAGGDSQQRN